MNPALTLVDEIATDVACGDMAPCEALAELRARGFTPDPDALHDAVAAIEARDRFTARDGDPYAYLEAEPRPGLDAYDTAARLAEEQLEDALRRLARRHVTRRAS